jgi:hypothetical protein
MRKLGHGQSVLFCVSEEIKSKILQSKGLVLDEKPKEACIDVSDVLIWAVSETCAELRRNMALWATQGARYQHQRAIWAILTSSEGLQMSQEQAELFLEDEAQSLEFRYRPTAATCTAKDQLQHFDNLDDGSVAAILKWCEEFDSLQFRASVLQEEQERELSPEIEQERQVEKPRTATPAKHELHQDVITFVETGRIASSSPAFQSAFATLSNTSAAEHLNPKQFPDDIRVTADYTRTINLVGKNPCTDSFQRPIQWILTSTGGGKVVQQLVIISPYEAQELMPRIRKSKYVVLHDYAPQLSLAFPTLDSLRLYTRPPLPEGWRLPTHLRLQLNIFAGQLYFNSFDDYKETCDILGLAWKETGKELTVEADGFIVRKHGDPKVRFKKSPVNFLKVLFTRIRRNCEGIDKTHWGRVLGGEVLTEEDFPQREGHAAVEWDL